MAQDFWSADDHSIGDTLADLPWTDELNVNGAEIKQDASGDHYLEVDFADDAESNLTFDDGDAEDQEVWLLWYIEDETDGAGPIVGPFVRGQDVADGSNFTFYKAQEYDAEGDGWIEKVVDSSGTELDSVSPEMPFDTKINTRLRANGSDLNARRWEESQSEPGTWELSATDSDITGSGQPGMWQYRDCTVRIYAVGVGTNGDSAPTTEAIGATRRSLALLGA